ncbi:hypothetical protein Niako_5137 [Niastella koreensis GR20-10]|uniref:DUF4476 domain-containing protein n=2 Tax=Niastella koreensis TaxID=354356 RepID=G8TB29_NIAKG|nr:DUF4476 domain-containing protein [Niastella koreensis]AEW01376.1 hypothetical protein Niako_5137 [Niastella koreensis GR20-10]
MSSYNTALAQQSLYVYLQSENLQPFYVQMDDKVYSSSAIGHLIIAGLPDQTCNFEIGFPQQASQPQRFSIPLKNKDHGFQLVQRSKGWALLDLQTDETIKPTKDPGNSNLLYGERKKDDAFATLMAAVVNDSSVLYTSIVKKEADKVPDVAGANDKPADNQATVKGEEKTVQTQQMVNPYSVEAIVDSAVKKGSTPTPGTSTGTTPATDSAVTKYDPKERSLTDKPVVAGVAKIQQQTKNGETKMVFVDSSETPAKVVTVYINEEKEAENKPAVQTQPAVTPATDNSTTANVVKNEAKQEPEVKDSGRIIPQPKELVAEQIKKETWHAAAEEKKPATTDTVTIILESPQMKKAVAAEEPKPLYRPKPETQPEPVKPVAKDTAAGTAKLFDYGKMQVELVQGNAVVKEESVKPVAADSSVKTAVTPIKKDKEEPAKETPKAVMEQAVTKKDTAVAVTKPAETEKPKTVEPEKKAAASGKLVMINSDCQKLATDNDVDKMRVKMMAEGDEQKRLAVAQKYFKTMCLYAKQIKALSELFTGDESKYKFLEQAYPFAADTANFKQLYELLSDEAYVTRFKKLVRLQ